MENIYRKENLCYTAHLDLRTVGANLIIAVISF